MSEWQETTLGNVVRLQRGHDLTEGERRPGKVPVIGSAGQNGWHDTAKAPGPGVTIGRSGASAGVVTYVDREYWPHNTSLYVTDFCGSEPRFIAYYLSTLRLAELNSGSAQPSLNRNFLYNVPVLLPPQDEQRRIASILSAYDDLIEANRRRVAILEEMARRLFEEWFVHLRFPGHATTPLHDTPDGPVPEGWSFMPLGRLVAEQRHAVSPTDLDVDTMYVGLEHLPRRSTTLTDWGKARDVVSTKLRFHRGDVLFGKIRPYFHKVAVAPSSGVSSTDAIVLRSRASEHAGLVAAVASSDAFVAHAVQTSNGTKMPRANWNVLDKYPVRVPPALLLHQFNSVVVNSVQLASSLAAANRRLAVARDLLLPRLLSGQLSVAQDQAPALLAAE